MARTFAVLNEAWHPLQSTDVECFDVDTNKVLLTATSDTGGIASFADADLTALDTAGTRYLFRPKATRTDLGLARIQEVSNFIVPDSVGPAGPAGPTGPAGAVGATGPQGPAVWGLGADELDQADDTRVFSPLTFQAPGTLIGLTAVAGTSSNALRSDAAPALSQAIVPTWTGAHIWKSTNQLLKLQPDVSPPIRIDSAANPSSNNGVLVIVDVGGAVKGTVESQSFGTGGQPQFNGLNAGGTEASPTHTVSNAHLVGIGGGGYDNAGTPARTGIKVQISLDAEEDWTTTAQGTHISFHVTPVGSLSRAEHFRMLAAGMQAFGYLNAAGSLVAPSNTTAGDITGLRGHFGTDSAFTTVNSLTATLEVHNGAFYMSGTITNNGAGQVVTDGHVTLNGSGDSPQGILGRPVFAPSASITNAYGFLGNPHFAPPVGVTITNANCFFAAPVYDNTAGAVTTGRAFLIASPSGMVGFSPGTQIGLDVNNQGFTGMTNAIGVQIAAQSGATNNYDMSLGTVDLTAAGAYYGRFPVLYNGLKKYIHVFS